MCCLGSQTCPLWSAPDNLVAQFALQFAERNHHPWKDIKQIVMTEGINDHRDARERRVEDGENRHVIAGKAPGAQPMLAPSSKENVAVRLGLFVLRELHVAQNSRVFRPREAR